MNKPTRLWLSVQQADKGGWTMGGSGDLYVREVLFAHLPDVGETIYVLASEEEPEGTMGLHVYARYWDLDGTANLSMQTILVDPNQDVQDRIFRGQFSGGPCRYTSWYTDLDGEDLRERLLQHWMTHEAYRG